MSKEADDLLNEGILGSSTPKPIIADTYMQDRTQIGAGQLAVYPTYWRRTGSFFQSERL